MSSNLVVETFNLTKKYKNFIAVNNINLKIKKGRIYGFLGPNGAGKSTTLGMLLGLIKPSGGSIKVFDKDLNKYRMDILGKVGSMIETPAYYGNLTAYENLQISAELLNVSYKNIDDVLEIVDLSKCKDKQSKTFSLGMKQRLGVAQALIGNPELLILDEPTNGLDPIAIREMRELIKRLPQLYNMTIVISSHILSEIELIADDIGIIHNSNLLFQGGLQELLNEHKGKNLEAIFLDILNTEECV